MFADRITYSELVEGAARFLVIERNVKVFFRSLQLPALSFEL
ncbi:hypothetical protein D3OALGA1CA_4552 [Olavius algarvensis associated proteobacterium Delta 3]|nr:hypothetical protein D3OALGB2SA_1589 [Olavius algarvensis associated proteobacterium Delta 3]CAB5153212.1 hypothetical protein D3OALGA1CA_4552 [Olavius algarvensis associated proteobacterium Delta 3]